MSFDKEIDELTKIAKDVDAGDLGANRGIRQRAKQHIENLEILRDFIENKNLALQFQGGSHDASTLFGYYENGDIDLEPLDQGELHDIADRLGAIGDEIMELRRSSSFRRVMKALKDAS